MKILHCEVQNFASYKNLEFDFENQGLCLISGPTGSGKSTLCDVVVWILFGRTAKGGAVDEIRSWTNEGPTQGILFLQLADNTRLTITRIRGTSKENDLRFTRGVETHQRGKDNSDTQKMINNILGFDYDLYMSGAYFHEFSTTASFFTTTAKVRRQITEQLVDLSLAKRLVDRAGEYKKEVKAELAKIQNELNVAEGILKSVDASIKSDKNLGSEWASNKERQYIEIQKKRDDYKSYHVKQLSKVLKEHKKRQEELETELLNLEKSIQPEADLMFYSAALQEEKRQLELTKGAKCPACGSVKGSKDKEILLMRREFELKQKEDANESLKRSMQLKIKELQRHNDSETNLKELHSEKENPYIKQLENLKTEENPYTKIIQKRNSERVKLTSQVKELKISLGDFTREFADLELLLDVTDTFRAALVKNTVVDLETNTNQILSDYFDSEIQVKFELSDADKLETTITKDGNPCVYTQLSKGQRQLLKLSFAISVMKCVSNHHGIHFNAIFLDEALDGLDDVLKVKSYDLLQSLAAEHSSVLVVEHNEALKTLFPRRYEVTLTNDGSELEAA